LKSPNPRNYFSRKQNGEVSEGEREMEAKEKRGEAVDEVGLDWEFVGMPDAVEEALVVFGEGGLRCFWREIRRENGNHRRRGTRTRT
jgi:hypothetical protein